MNIGESPEPELEDLLADDLHSTSPTSTPPCLLSAEEIPSSTVPQSPVLLLPVGSETDNSLFSATDVTLGIADRFLDTKFSFLQHNNEPGAPPVSQ